MVSLSLFKEIIYDPRDTELLEDQIGLNDPNRDGELTAREYNSGQLSSFRDFYQTKLTTRERSFLGSFTKDAPLSRQNFLTHDALARIAQKHLRYRQFDYLKNKLHLPAEQPVTLPAAPAHPNTDFTGVILNIARLKRDLSAAQWDLLTKNKLEDTEKQLFPSPLIHVLRSILRANVTASQIVLTESFWHRIFAQLAAKNPKDFARASPASTWNELMLVWEKCDDIRDNMISRRMWRNTLDHVDNSPWGDDFNLIFLPQRYEISAKGLKEFLTAPQKFHVDITTRAPSTPNRLQEGHAHWEITWPKRPAQIKLKALKLQGKTLWRKELELAELNLDIDEKARAVAAQNTDNGLFNFSLGSPLLWLEGFRLNVDASRHTRWLAAFMNMLSQAHGKDFDIESLSVKGITLFNNRLCLVVRGEDNNRRDIAKPVFRDLLLIDISPIIKKQLDKKAAGARLSTLLFDSNANVTSQIPTGDLTHALFDFLKSNSLSQNNSAIPTKEFQHNLWMTGFSLSPDQNVNISQANIHATGRWPETLVVKGKAQIDIALKNNGQDLSIKGPLEFYLDFQKQSGFARLELPQLKLFGADEKFNAHILAAVNFDPGDLFKNGQVDVDAVLKKISASLLIELEKGQSTWLAALVENLQAETGLSPSVNGDIDAAFHLPANNVFGVLFNGKFALTKGADNEWILSPHTERFLMARDGEQKIETGDIGGQIRIQKSGTEKDGNFIISIENLGISLDDAFIHTETVSLRGRTRATLNGKWQVAAKSPRDVFLGPSRWHGAGDLIIDHKNSDLHVTAGNTLLDLTKASQVTTIHLSDIAFPQVEAEGIALHHIEDGDFKTETPLFDLETNITGSVTAIGKLPKIMFSGTAAEMDLSTDTLPHQDTSRITTEFSDLKPRDFIDSILAPVIDEVFNTKNTPKNFDFYLSRNFPLEAMLTSVKEATLRIGEIPLAENGFYRKGTGGREFTQIPFFEGALMFLNPKIEKGTKATMTVPQNIVVDDELQDFKIDLNPPIRFLGRRIISVGLAACHLSGNKNRKHLYLFTPMGKIDLMGFLRVAFSCKIAKVYHLLHQDGLRMQRNQIPTKMAEFGRFLRHFIDVFEFERKVREKTERQILPFTAEEFSHLTASQKQQTYQVLAKTALARNVSRGTSSLHSYLNRLTQRQDLAEYFDQNLDRFSEKTSGQARSVVEGILLLKFMRAEEGLSDQDRNSITQNNRKLLRLFLQPYIQNTSWLNGRSIKDIHADITLKPQKGNYGIITFKEDAKTSVTTALKFNPTEYTHPPLGKILPGFYLSTATGEGETLENIFFNLKTNSLWVRGDFNRARKLYYYLGPENRNKEMEFMIAFEDADVDNLNVLYMPPNPFARPSFALFSPTPSAIGKSNHLLGGNFYLGFLDDSYHYILDVKKLTSDSTYGYFFLGQNGKERDMLINTAGAKFTDFHFDTQLNRKSFFDEYTTSLNAMKGHIELQDDEIHSSRAMLYIGDHPEDGREYLVIDKFAANGDVDMEGDQIRCKANMHLKADIPEYMRFIPALEKLRQKGITFDFKSLSLDGSLIFSFDEDGGNVRREPLGNAAFEATSIRLHGNFDITVKDTKIRLSEIRLPLFELAFRMKRNLNSKNQPFTETWISKIIIPENEPGQARLDLSIKLPEKLGSRIFEIKEGELSLRSKSPLVFTDESTQAPTLTTEGLSFGAGNNINTLDLSTGSVHLTREGGTIENWQIEAELREIILDTVFEILLQGDLLKIKVKNPD